MTVIAIKCVNCDGHGVIDQPARVTPDIWEYPACPVCDGTGMERPPQDHDKSARKHVEGEDK